MAAILATALTSVIWWTFRPSTPPATISRFSFTLPEGQAFTFTITGRQYVALSPDGTEIAYMANRRIYLRSISDFEPRAIPGTEIMEGATNPVFSPDGRFIAFFSYADDTLKKLAMGGGAAGQIDGVLGVVRKFSINIRSGLFHSRLEHGGVNGAGRLHVLHASPRTDGA